MTTQHRTVINAEALLFSNLFHNGLFVVPWHQRYYDWKADDVRALLLDIDEAIKEDRDCYFLGTIMLVEVEPRKWEINDGQQRMVTVSLICAVLGSRFAREATGSQREGFALRMLFDLDTNSVWTYEDVEHYTPRISPPQNDAMRYRQMIRGNTIGTNGKLTAAWTEIEKFFTPMNLKKSEEFFDFLHTKLEVACLRVPSNLDSNAVYETLNNRGKMLDDLDLIRNHLYSYFNVVGESERRLSVHENLERIRTTITSTNKASEYLRCHLQCRFGFLRKDNFYRDVRSAIQTRSNNGSRPVDSLADYAFHLTKQITAPESLELFQTMTATGPDAEFIRVFEKDSGTTNSPRNLEVFLRELSGYKVTQPLVFAILTWYIQESDGRKKRRIARIANRNLNRLATFVLRTAFVAPKFEPSHFETEFSNYAKHVATTSDLPNDEFADFLRDCDNSEHGVLDDSRFQNAMIEATMKGNSKIKQFLLGINRNMPHGARLLNERSCNVEHILPESPQHWNGWVGFDEYDRGDWVHRIGNLTLMGPTDNRPGPKYNGNFAKKRESYNDSEVALTRELSKYDDWTPNIIEKRQREMAKRAVQAWTFD